MAKVFKKKKKVWIVETKSKLGGKWRNAGPYKFAKKSDFGSLPSLKRANPTRNVRLRRILL